MASSLGDKLKDLRKQKNMTLEELSTLAGLSKSYLWELENRDSRRPSAEKLIALADELGVTTAFLLDEDLRTPDEQHRDEVFFRGYKNLDPDAKEQVRKIIETFKKKT